MKLKYSSNFKACPPNHSDFETELYCDGGVVTAGLQTPRSPYGIVQGVVLVKDGEVVYEGGRLIVCGVRDGTPELLTNQNSEIFALCTGLNILKGVDVKGEALIATDSHFTLSVFYGQDKYDSQPGWLISVLRGHRKEIIKKGLCCRLKLLGGHPKPIDLESGIRLSKAPHLPVSKYNVRCHEICEDMKLRYPEALLAERKRWYEAVRDNHPKLPPLTDGPRRILKHNKWFGFV